MGRKGNSGMSSGGGISKSQLHDAASDYLKHNMASGTQSVSLEKATLVSDVDEYGYAAVKMDYTATMQIATGFDAETHQMEYEYETQYRSETFKIKVK